MSLWSFFYCVVGMIYLLYVYNSCNRNILNPNFFFAAYWIGFTMVGSLFSDIIGFKYYIGGVFIIIIHTLSFNIGGVIAAAAFAKNKKRRKEKLFYVVKVKQLRLWTIIFSILGTGSLIVLIHSQGFSIYRLVNFSAIFEIANSISIDRYGGALSLPITYKLLSVFSYSSIFLGGILYSYKEKKMDNIIAFIPILISFLNAMLNGARAGLLMAILLFIAVILMINIVKRKKLNQFKVLKVSSIILIVFVFIFFFIQALRGGKKDIDVYTMMSDNFQKLFTYAFGSFNAFTIWWENHSSIDLGLGKYTFSGIYDILYGDREVGIFSKPVMISSTQVTNVYTIFRVTIEDFSLIGSIFVFILLGFWANFAYLNIFYRKRFVVVLSLIYFICLWSFITNPITYNTIFISWILNFVVIHLIISRKRVELY